MRPHYRTIHIDVFWLVILTNATLARSNSALPDDVDYTETCWSCFNVNFNVNFKIVLRQFIRASVGKQIKLDSIKMHGMYVKITKNCFTNWNSTPCSMALFRSILLRPLTLILRRSCTGTVWFYTSTSNKRAARPKLYTKSLARDLKRMYSRLTLVRISNNL